MTTKRAKPVIGLKPLVSAFVKAGKAHGFFFAEMVLARYLPAHNSINGRCFHVPVQDRSAMIGALDAGPELVKASKEGGVE